MSTTQNERLLSHLKGGSPITPYRALSLYGIFRLAARVHDLRGAGHDIHMRLIDATNRFGDMCRVAEYTLITTGKADG